MSNVKQLPTPVRKKVAIVGFTKSKELAPWDDPTFEKWICNNLHLFVPDKWQRIYDLHDDKTIHADPRHLAFLQANTTKPVVVWDPRPEWPASVAFPKRECIDAFGRYFTNSISWMIAHAIMENAEEIHVYGVDMAQSSEYGAQRPSCEYFLGLAVGMGIKVYVPPTSDLLKVTTMYGIEDDSAFYTKAAEREGELQARMHELQAQLSQGQLQMASFQGALETTRYFKNVWTNARTNGDPKARGEVEVLEGSPVYQAIVEAEASQGTMIAEVQSAESVPNEEAPVG